MVYTFYACLSRYLGSFYMFLFAEKACIRVAQRYVQILDLLDEVYQAKREPEIYGLRATVTRKDIVVMILCLCDILAPLGRLSLYLQGSINFTHVTHQVQGVIDQLHTLIDRMRQDDPDLYTYKVDEFLTEIDQRTDLARRQRIHIQVGFNAIDVQSQLFFIY